LTVVIGEQTNSTDSSPGTTTNPFTRNSDGDGKSQNQKLKSKSKIKDGRWPD